MKLTKIEKIISDGYISYVTGRMFIDVKPSVSSQFENTVISLFSTCYTSDETLIPNWLDVFSQARFLRSDDFIGSCDKIEVCVEKTPDDVITVFGFSNILEFLRFCEKFDTERFSVDNLNNVLVRFFNKSECFLELKKE